MVDLFEAGDVVNLKEERKHTLVNLTHLREALKYEIGPTIDQNDPFLKEHEMVLTQIQVLERRLESIDEALQQAKQGTYGLCKRCGKPIDPARLEILPEATLCFPCKTIMERQISATITAAPPLPAPRKSDRHFSLITKKQFPKKNV